MAQAMYNILYKLIIYFTYIFFCSDWSILKNMSGYIIEI